MGSNKFDDILSALGTGPWNIFILISISYWMMCIPLQTLSGAFLTPVIPHTCHLPSNATTLSQNNYTQLDQQCLYLMTDENSSIIEEPQPCTHLHYDQTTYGFTLTQEFNLVCNRKFLRPLYNSLYFFGSFFGSPFNGWLSDRYGRKTMITIGSIFYSVLANIISWLPNLTAIFVVRFIQGLAHSSALQAGYSLVMECFEAHHRPVAGIVIFFPWCLGMIIFGGVAYAIQEWRWIIFSSSLFLLPFLPLLWFIDESPRWLIVRGNHSKAIQVLNKAARWNKVSLPSDQYLETLMMEIMAEPNQCKVAKEGFISRLKNMVGQFSILVRSKQMRRITLSVFYLLLSSGLAYDGLSLGGDGFSSDPYIYMVISGVMEIPGATFTIPIVRLFGRRRPNVILYCLTSLVLLSISFIPKKIGWLIMVLALLGKLTLSAAYQIIYLHSTELFPTEVRTRGMGSSAMMARLGSTLAPFLIDSLRSVWGSAPSVVLGGSSMLAAIVTLILPETKDTALHDTVTSLEEANQERKLEHQRRIT